MFARKNAKSERGTKLAKNSEGSEFVHRDTLEFGGYDAVLQFNIGCNAIVELFKSMNTPAGKYTELAWIAEDKSRVSLAQYESNSKAEERKVIKN